MRSPIINFCVQIAELWFAKCFVHVRCARDHNIKTVIEVCCLRAWLNFIWLKTLNFDTLSSRRNDISNLWKIGNFWTGLTGNSFLRRNIILEFIYVRRLLIALIWLFMIVLYNGKRGCLVYHTDWKLLSLMFGFVAVGMFWHTNVSYRFAFRRYKMDEGLILVETY